LKFRIEEAKAPFAPLEGPSPARAALLVVVAFE
jgi:hypothetical protein